MLGTADFHGRGSALHRHFIDFGSGRSSWAMYRLNQRYKKPWQNSLELFRQCVSMAMHLADFGRLDFIFESLNSCFSRLQLWGCKQAASCNIKTSATDLRRGQLGERKGFGQDLIASEHVRGQLVATSPWWFSVQCRSSERRATTSLCCRTVLSGQTLSEPWRQLSEKKQSMELPEGEHRRTQLFCLVCSIGQWGSMAGCFCANGRRSEPSNVK